MVDMTVFSFKSA